jgi:tRNA-specific 2-thiouridylase
MRRLGLKHIVIDLTKEYEKYVLDYFRKEYLSGKTPNPCVVCNQKLKFGFLQKKIFSYKDSPPHQLKKNNSIEKSNTYVTEFKDNWCGGKFDLFATGHYARIKKDKRKNKFLLLAGCDAKKDQSYFLYRLSQAQLKKSIFPLGEMQKTEVKELARKSGFADYAEKIESQDFVEGKNYDLIFNSVRKKPGNILDMSGKVLGQHDGIHNFTIGQRKGLKVGGMAEPYYVVDIDRCKNAVIIGSKDSAFSDVFFLKNTNWIALDKLDKKISAKVKLRSSSQAVDATIVPENGRLKIKLKKPQFALTAGQAAVFYKKDVVLGGGTISLK